MEKTNKKKFKLLYVSFNDDVTHFALGLEDGFEIYEIHGLKKIYKKELNGGIGFIEMVGSSNILALVGGGKFPYFDNNRIILWDLGIDEKVEEFRLDSAIKSIKVKDK